MIYSKKIARIMIEHKMTKVLNSINNKLNLVECVDVVEGILYNEFRITESLSIETIKDCVDRSIGYWKDDNRELFRED